MPQGRHAAPKAPRGRHARRRDRGPGAAAARTALARTTTVTLSLGLSWTAVTAVAGQGYLDAFAAGTSARQDISSAGSSPSSSDDKQLQRITALSKSYECSSDGFAPGIVPARTIVRVEGRIRVATFDEGWAMHLGDVPGTLVSVCAR